MACGDRGGGSSVNRSLFTRDLNFDPLEVGGLGHVTRIGVGYIPIQPRSYSSGHGGHASWSHLAHRRPRGRGLGFRPTGLFVFGG